MARYYLSSALLLFAAGAVQAFAQQDTASLPSAAGSSGDSFQSSQAAQYQQRSQPGGDSAASTKQPSKQQIQNAIMHIETSRKRLDIRPYVEGSVSYSDNINLQDDDNKESGLATQLGTGVAADYQNNRVNALGHAGVQAIWRNGDGDSTTIAPHINALATTELVRRRVYLDVDGSYSHSFDRFGGALSRSGASNSSDTGIGQFSISPNYRQPLGRWAVGEARFTHSQFLSPADNFANSMTNSGQIGLSTSDRFRRIGLQAIGVYSKTEAEEIAGLASGDMERKTGQLTASYRVSPKFALIARGGYDDIDSPSFSDDYSGASYAGGFEWFPTNRSRLYAMVGSRYNNLNVEADASYVLNNIFTAGASVNTTIVAGNGNRFTNLRLSGNQFAGVLQAATQEGRTPVDYLRRSFNINPESVELLSDGSVLIQGDDLRNQSYYTQMASAYITGQYQDTAGQLSVFAENQDFDNTDDLTAVGITANVSHRFSPRWSGSADAFYQTFISDDDFYESDTLGMRVAASYRVLPKAWLTLALSRTQRNGNDVAGSIANDYTEHAVTLGARAEF